MSNFEMHSAHQARKADSAQAPRFQIQNFGHKDFEPSKNEKKFTPPGFFFCLRLSEVFLLCMRV